MQRRVALVLAAIVVAAGAFLFSFGGDSAPEAVLPDVETTSGDQFSLDMKVINSAPLDVVYVVEQRARPGYRIFAFDARTGTDETIFTVPEDAIIYGITLSPDNQTLAVAYTEQHAIGGSGLWLLDLETSEFTEVAPDEADVFLTEPEWAADGESVFVTHVDRRGEAEVLSVAEVSLVTGAVEIVAPDAITPAVDGDELFFLTVDENKARRTIAVLGDGGSAPIIVGDESFDLDHLVATERSASGSLHVAVLEQVDEPTVTIGEEAAAHGNHNVKSTWWGLDVDEIAHSEALATNVEPIIVYDAAATDDGTIVYATLEGLSYSDGEKVDLIASRAIRFVAG